MIFVELKQATNIEKELTPKTLRHTHVVRALKRGEGFERVLLRLGLSETTWEDAKIKYLKLSAGGFNS